MDDGLHTIGLPTHPSYRDTENYLSNGAGAVLVFALKDVGKLPCFCRDLELVVEGQL